MTDASGCRLVRIGDHQVSVRELTVAQVRQLMDTITADTVGDALLNGLRLHDLTVMTSLTSSQIDELVPSQLEELAEACRGANRHFFEMLERLANLLVRP